MHVSKTHRLTSPPDFLTASGSSSASNFILISYLVEKEINQRRRCRRLYTRQRSPHLLSASQLWSIDCNEKRFDAPFLSVLNDALRDLAIFVDVELKELDLIGLSRIDELVEGARCKRRYLQRR